MHFLQSNFNISERLKTCASFVPKGSLICDIGSDHAIIPIYLLSEKIIERIIITDINEKPLQHAKAEMSKFGYFDKAEYLLTDGVSDTLIYSPDGFIIAGMSGETIIGILDRCKNDLNNGSFFILQPMTRDYLLRKYLYENGFEIHSEKCVFENSKVFITIFCIFTGINITKSDETYYFGEFFDSFSEESQNKYIKIKSATLNRIIEGKNTAKQDHQYESNLLKYIEERRIDENQSN